MYHYTKKTKQTKYTLNYTLVFWTVVMASGTVLDNDPNMEGRIETQKQGKCRNLCCQNNSNKNLKKKK